MYSLIGGIIKIIAKGDGLVLETITKLTTRLSLLLLLFFIDGSIIGSMSYKDTIQNSTSLSEITGDFDVDPKSQLCGVSESTMVKESPDETTTKQNFSFTSSFQANTTKSNCRGDVVEDKNTDTGNNFCRQSLGDHLSVQGRISSNNLFSSDQLSNSAVSDVLENNIESIKSLSLKPDTGPSGFPSLNSSNSKNRDLAFSGMTGDVNPFSFERSQSAQKFDACNFLGDGLNTNSSGKSHSTPESSSGIDGPFNGRNPLLQDSESSSITNENHIGGSSTSYWGTPGNAQVDDLNSQSGLNNLSPLLTNLLFHQTGNSPVSTSSGSQPNSSIIAAKRALMGGHQGVRPSLSRPPGWSPSTTSFDSSFPPPSDQSSFSGMPSSKNPNWMSQISSQNSGNYPWSSTSSQQNSFKASFSEAALGFPGNNIGNGSMRFGPNPNLSSIGSSNGFPKNATSNPTSMYSMFPKRQAHRAMTHWQSQHQSQQHMQQTPPSALLNKQQHNNSDFSGSGSGQQDSILNQKLSHGNFGSGLMSGNMDGLNADKYSNFAFDQHLIEIMKSMDSSSGNSQSGLLDDLGLGMSGIDNYHGGNLHSLSNLPQTRSGLMQNQGLHGLSNAHPNLNSIAPREEGYSRKVFVGGLPPDIDEEEITTAFRRFGALIVDWPHKTESKAYFPPKGYCFLLFQEEQSVQNLINACIVDEGKYYWCVSSPTMKDKPVQIRPWNLADSDFVMDGSQTLDPRKTIFVGGVPRPLRAIELALIMDRLYGGVCYAGIDIDPELKYPKGAGRVAFSNQQSYIAAISARFVQLQHNDIDKRVEVKPYVLDNQMCDECQGARCGGKFAPLFCANVTCLQYYCEQCWMQIHSRQGREFHKPLVKEGAERPRPALYRW
nr:cytoplasmic polyadenylation element binding [Hymenolepis microstoma]